jgi:uncharacterized protein (TIGR03437 family)
MGCGAANAAPQLRLTSAALGPLVIQQGSTGPLQTVNAANIGTGSLNLTATSNVTWLSPSVTASTACQVFGTCLPITIALQTSALAPGVYTGIVTVSDPNAIDSPQTITVTVQIGGGIPSSVTLYAAPGGKATQTIIAASQIKSTSTAAWLSVALNGAGTYQFAVPYELTANASGLAANDYTGTVTVTGSSFAPDNKDIAVTLHVTSNPIAQPNLASLSFEVAANSINQTQTVYVSNAGLGTLQVGTVTATPASGTWLTATASGNSVAVVANPTGLSPGSYPGTVTIASNAANSSITIPVQFTVDAQSGPVATYQSAVNNATFVAGEAVAPGDIMAIFGTQFLYNTPVGAVATPLPTQLKGGSSTTEVLVNGVAAPLYYAAYGQIDFQLPYETQGGKAIVQVVRDGVPGNQISVEVVPDQPRILPFAVGNYGIIQNATEGGFAISTAAGAALGISTVHPAKAGTDYLTIYVLGLGPVSPAVATGAAAPTVPPLANTTLQTKVIFSSGNPFGVSPTVNASFSGLAPGFVGLYQVNVQVPANAPKGDSIGLYLVTGGVASNSVNIAIE